MADPTLRVFVALPLPDTVKQYLAALQQGLNSATEEALVRWVEPQGLHLTLKFLGNISAARVSAVARALETAARGVGPFSLRFSALGAFPTPERPRIIWVGAMGEVAALETLYRDVERGLTGLGFPAEARSFSPHITLGRVREHAKEELQRSLGQAIKSAASLNDVPPALVQEVVCYQSTLTPKGAYYAVLAAAPLSDPGNSSEPLTIRETKQSR